MNGERIGILHPGKMGESVAASAKEAGNTVYWVSDGRSDATRQRAVEHSLSEVATLAELCRTCSVIVSVCPPHGADQLADQVMSHAFTGIYVDANAISPQRSLSMAERVADAGASFVDGGIVGGPAWTAGETRLYLAGERAAEVAALFRNATLDTCVIGDAIGKASALKMCYAANTKGTTALLCAVMATADRLGVVDELRAQWAHDDVRFAERSVQRVRRVTAKAWRFAGEMREISATFGRAGLPEGFHSAAAEIYERMAGFKDAGEVPPLESVLAALQIAQE